MNPSQTENYTIERTFISQSTLDDILGRIVKAHLNPYNLTNTSTCKKANENADIPSYTNKDAVATGK